jgi:hypothetical protein
MEARSRLQQVDDQWDIRCDLAAQCEPCPLAYTGIMIIRQRTDSLSLSPRENSSAAASKCAAQARTVSLRCRAS